jgi:2-polyprenyl-3-methyl-5-hydroxy-6-metoxy-1,4-benzoquinol methylase
VTSIQSMSSKLPFLRRVVRHRLERQARRCPYCNDSSDFELIGRKKILVEILRCKRCRLIFRHPRDTQEDNYEHYQNEYSSGPVTVFPDDERIRQLKSSVFAGAGELDEKAKIDVLSTLRPNGTVLDFGCSWGYGVYQLQSRGYQAMGFEISKPRAQFGREKLGVEILDDVADLRSMPRGSFDIIFSNHVLEHLPAFAESMDLLSSLLARGGLFFAVIPNFKAALSDERIWTWIGQEHPVGPTAEFLTPVLLSRSFERVAFGSSPFDEDFIRSVGSGSVDRFDLTGEELLIMAWKG